MHLWFICKTPTETYSDCCIFAVRIQKKECISLIFYAKKKKINVRIKTLIVYMANLFPVSHFIINLFSLFFFSFSFREKKSEIRKFFLSILLFIFFFTKLNGIQVKEKENFVMNLKHFIFLIWFYIGKIGLPIL